MFSYIKLFFIGMLISFLGQLPLGNMNITATQLHLQEGLKNACKFGLGIAIVEVIYLRLALTGMNWVLKHHILFEILGWVTVAIFLLLGILGLIAASRQREDKKSVLLNNKLDRFLLGLSISAINPVQIPFWFTWSIYLVRERLLAPSNLNYNLFTIGAGFGTLAGLAVYIFAGKWAAQKMKANNKGMNIFISVVFIAVALLQLYKMIFSPWTKENS
jgi:threonine/homoserine/homoserine lactone efflux protein